MGAAGVESWIEDVREGRCGVEVVSGGVAWDVSEEEVSNEMSGVVVW